MRRNYKRAQNGVERIKRRRLERVIVICEVGRLVRVL
jgi:hypothetical protein